MIRQRWVRSISVAAAGAVVWAMTGQAQALVGSLPAHGDQGPPLPAVVRVEADHGVLDRGLTCTGTVIAAQWVVTAQHCTNIGREPGHPYRAREIVVRPDQSVSVPGQRRLTVAAVWRMEGYDAGNLVNDVALLRLSEPLTGVTPVRIASAPVPAGRDAYAYGFGESSPGGGKPRAGPHMAEVRATSLAALNDGPCLFPDPVHGSLTFVASVHGGSSPGDSGGPTLTWSGDVPALHTVTGGAADRRTCGSGSLRDRPADWVGIYNRVDRASAAWPFLSAHVPGL